MHLVQLAFSSALLLPAIDRDPLQEDYELQANAVAADEDVYVCRL